jgi:DNA polymerase (family 10)
MYNPPEPETTLTAADAAKVLFNCATLLEMADSNRYRVAAYRRAGLVLLQLGDLAPRVVANDEALRALGFGKRLTRKLRELFATGELGFYDGLLADLPWPIAGLVRLPGIGPKTALRLYNELGISSPQALAAAAQAGNIRKLPGFGPRREAAWAGVAGAPARPQQLPLPEPAPAPAPRPLPPATRPTLPRAA